MTWYQIFWIRIHAGGNGIAREVIISDYILSCSSESACTSDSYFHTIINIDIVENYKEINKNDTWKSNITNMYTTSAVYFDLSACIYEVLYYEYVSHYTSSIFLK